MKENSFSFSIEWMKLKADAGLEKRLTEKHKKILSATHTGVLCMWDTSKTLTFSPFLLTKASLSPCIEVEIEMLTSS